MKFLSTVAFMLGVQSTAAFVAGPSNSNSRCALTPTALNGFFGDLFDAEKRKEREAAREREIEEQMAYQREIMERRENPEKMEEYMARVSVRQTLRMNGEDDAADNVAMYRGDVEEQ
mmetsp:Transcript_11140/g.25988  ORF Transcript_11140/g.25988 Transcript_11140/m.25988 type:complete len:117 (-) Transcript_11140:1951-2301(-)